MKTNMDEIHDNNRIAINYPGNDKLLQAKNVFFYRDGNEKKGFVKVAVHPNRYRSLDALLNELTQKMPDLSFGVRSIYTPKGHNKLVSLNDLNNEENYVCSQSSNKAKGIDVSKIKRPLLNFKSSNQYRFNTAPLGAGETELRIKRFEKKKEIKQLRAPASVPESENEQTISFQNQLSHKYQKLFIPGIRKGQHKRILIKRNGSSDYQQVVLLNRRTAKSFEQFMDDLSGIFLMPVRRLYTLEGKEVQSLSAIFNGPNTFVAAGFERFRPMAAWATDFPTPSDYRLTNGQDKPISVRKTGASKGRWIIRIETLDTEPNSGTNANVYFTIYGRNRVAAPFHLNLPINIKNKKVSLFQPGQIDEFEVTTGFIGDIIKIRINHDNSGDSPDWLVGSVQMEDKDTNEVLVFTFNRWFSLSKDGNEIVRELPATHEGSFVLPVVKYRVVIFTGDCWNAGTSGKVFICLYGEHGDTGPRQLHRSLFDSSRLFEKGHSDTFEIESVSVGKLKRLMIGHSAVGPGNGWYLDKVIVSVTPLSSENKIPDAEVVFPCNRWLDHGEDDGKTTRELKPQDNFRHNALEKEMWEYEKWKFQKHNIVTIFSQSTWKCIKINNDGTLDALGEEKESECHFEVVVGDQADICCFKSAADSGNVITLKGIEICGGNGKGICGKDSEFQVRVQPDRTVALEIKRLANHHVMVNPNSFSLSVSKGPVSIPGKAFFVYCKGIFRNETVISFSTSLIQTLAVSHDNSLTATGKRNKTAHFIIHKIFDDQKCFMFESFIFPNQFIRIKNGRCDCKGTGEKDCLFKVEKYKERGYVTLQSIESRGIYLGMNPDGVIKPTVDTGDKNVRFYPEIIKFGKSHRKLYREDPLGHEIEHLEYVSSERSVGHDEILIPSLINTAQLSNMAEEKDYYTEGDWKVSVYSAQTAEHCEVILIIYGEEGCSGPIILGKSGDMYELFQAGAMNEFKINVPIVGFLYKIRIELKPIDVGAMPFWCLQQIILENIVTDEKYVFPFNNRFFGRGYDDNELCRESVAMSSEGSIPIVKYRVWLVTGSEPGADCLAPISVSLFGEYGDSGDREFYSPFIVMQPSFRKGMTDEMTIECAYLGEIKRCKVSVQTFVPNSGWYCEKIVVEDPLSRAQITFAGKMWFDPGKGDQITTKFLDVEETKILEVESDHWSDDNQDNPDEIRRLDSFENVTNHDVNVWELRYQAREMIEMITEQAANHVEKFHEMQLKFLENNNPERKK